jgi:5,5'-dehydrodivanillate O-demethylase
MLTVEQNNELTQVGPGTPMGELLRRYWYPIAFEQDFDSVPSKTVRLLSDNWTLYKTPSGKYGIIGEKCAHRRASLTYGVVHEDGIRCGYHGWKYDFDGQCTEQPAEADNQNFRDRVKMKSGKAQTMGGMVWVYVGPDPRPSCPRFDVFVRTASATSATRRSRATGSRSWRTPSTRTTSSGCTATTSSSARPGFRGAENVPEEAHAHRLRGDGVGHPQAPRPRGRHREGNDDWKIEAPLVFPFYMRVGGAYVDQMQIRVPIDETHTWKLFYSTHNPGEQLTTQERPTVYEYLWKDDEGRFITDYIEGQDIMAWVSQGPITDRTQEHLGRSDGGVALLRKMFKGTCARWRTARTHLHRARKHEIINLP